jgi:hypothetical protein
MTLLPVQFVCGRINDTLEVDLAALLSERQTESHVWLKEKPFKGAVTFDR